MPSDVVRDARGNTCCRQRGSRQHINYTNICSNRCLFCAYARNEGENGAFTFSINDVRAKLLKRIDEPVRELHVVGGLNSSIPFDYYLNFRG